ncbi:hypothetical protein HJC23_014024 [Cyclotella cryptica]|uniref:Uncharacterized protein n=1 Tax=Cyclotella cryptica TaxID=29204 RepID=A0ABD3QU31_9STRA|eukprot:CCRYP_002408-RA/>CCRYP_002408-RA protein AED:0.32 eAED:0.32 QI:0/-1/0/1/-1/1/1/0/384
MSVAPLRNRRRLVSFAASLLLAHRPQTTSGLSQNMSTTNRDLYRHDGVRITHDPYAPGMAEKYGTPGNTDSEGFDPYKDSVGPGIYGGIVQRRHESGEIVIGRQYQNHNPRPGPVYAGGGYAPSTLMLDDVAGKLNTLLEKFPDLVNDVTTGGAQPLHMCGMSRGKQRAVRALVERGADIEALDTYGMTPLHRMASNNLAEGARMLLEAGADVLHVGEVGETAASIARGSAAYDVLEVLEEAERRAGSRKSSGFKSNVVKLTVMGSVPFPDANGDYLPRNPATEIPSGFVRVCREQGWDANEMCSKLNGRDPSANIWFAHTDNDSYIYWNKSDKTWWIDGPDGLGVWIARGPEHAPPGRGWKSVTAQAGSGPVVLTFRKIGEDN